MSAEALREGRGNDQYYQDLLAQLIVEVTAGVYQLVTTTGITDRVMETLREGRPNNPYFEDLISKCMLYDAGTGKYYLNVSGGGGGGGNLQTTLDAGNSADNQSITLTKNDIENTINVNPTTFEIKGNYKTFELNNLTKIDIGGGSDNNIAGLLQINTINRLLGGIHTHNIHSGNSPSGSETNVYTHNLQQISGQLLQDNNVGGTTLNINGQITVTDANVYLDGDTSAIVLNDDTNARFTTLTGQALSINHSDGAGSPDWPLVALNIDALQFYDTSDGVLNVDIRPNQYNNQIVNWPDITGGMKTVGTYTGTFVAGVLSFTDSRFDIGTPNFLISITNPNSSSSIGVNYKFSVNPATDTVTITSLKSNAGTETADVSTVIVSCFY